MPLFLRFLLSLLGHTPLRLHKGASSQHRTYILGGGGNGASAFHFRLQFNIMPFALLNVISFVVVLYDGALVRQTSREASRVSAMLSKHFYVQTMPFFKI